MMQFVNNVWSALTSENVVLSDLLVIPLFPIENFVLMSLFLSLLNIKSTMKQKTVYIICLTIINFANTHLIPSPFNIIVNYICMLLFIKFIFKLRWFKSIIALTISTFIFALLNTLVQSPYLTICNIDLDKLAAIPVYRILYLIILYSFTYILCILAKNFHKLRFSFDMIENLNKKTLFVLYMYIFVGFLVLCIQLFTTAFYLDIVPIFISTLNFVLLLLFLILSIFSFTRVIQLSITQKNLECAEEYNQSLEILYDKVKGFKHDLDNIVSALDGYIENNDMDGLKKYFNEFKKDCKVTNNLSIINPRIINNPGIYSLLNNKYFKATHSGVTFDIDFFLNLNTLDINMYQLSRILGILIDNAIEEAEKCDEKIVKISFIRENKNNRSIITVKNTYSNKDVDIEKIFEKGLSGKENHSGIGLWEVRKYIKKSKNLDLYTNKDSKYFKQEL